ncbi:MAG TPA: HipA-like protein [Xenococcaceae cyanobacterium]
MSNKFPIITIPTEAPEESEEMGTKEKFWFHHEELGLCLYKKARQNTGEDWSEKIAAELCKLIQLPHAEYDLALFNNEKGTVSKSFLPENSSLVTGNEILAQIFLDYPEDINNLSQHTLNNIFSVFKNSSVDLPLNWIPLEGIETAIDTFIGYLILDAWIGNSDRHHENWAFIDCAGKSYLAPTYDHASSLGRNESDEKRRQRLETKDRGFSVEAYANKCKSCLYANVEDKKPLKTLDAFFEAAKLYPTAANIWLDRLARVSINDTLELFERIPDNLISSTAIEFAQKILEINQHKLLEFRDKL